MSEVTLDGNPAAATLTGAEIIAMIQSNADVSATINQIITLVNAAAQLAAIAQVTGLTAALANKLGLSGGTMLGALTLAADPTQALQAATKQYTDSLAAGLSVKTSCRVTTTANLTATYSNGTSGVGATLTNSGTQAALVIDGATLAVNDRVLVKDQSSALQNGIYVVTNIGSGSTNWVLTRSTDFDNSPVGEVVEGAYTIISEGTVNATNMYVETGAGPFTIGTTAITFSPFNSAANIVNGTGLNKSGNTFSIANTTVTPGTYNDGSKTINATVNAQGQLTALALIAIAITSSQVTDFNTAINALIAATVGISVQAFNAKLQSLSTVKGIGSISGNTNFVLTNPMNAIYSMNMGPSGLATLPVMNATNSPVPDSLIVFVNTGSQANDINLQDGSTFISQLPTGAKAFCFVTSNSTANGSWLAYRTDAAAITSGSINGVTTFASNASSNFFGIANSGSINSTLVNNPSNTASSDAVSKVSVGGASAGDAFFQAIINGVTTCSFGLDNSDSDAFVMSMSATLGTSNVLRISTGGQVTKPKQSAFLAYNSTLRSAVTGDGTVYTIPFNNTVFDQNSDFNTTTGTFTAPVTGRYSLTASILLTGLTAAVTSALMSIATSNRTYQLFDFAGGTTRDNNNNCIMNCSVLADMDAADVANITVVGGGTTKVISVSATTYDTTFTGYLAA